jgi:hypothetical protein
MAQREVDQHLQDYDEKNMGTAQGYSGAARDDYGSMAEKTGQTMKDTAQGMAQGASQMVSGAKAKAQQLGATVAEKASGATTSVGEGMSSLAGTIRHYAPSEGSVGSAASSVANQLDAAGSYLKDSNFENMANDLTALIRRYPLQSLFIGFGIGYFMARNSRR